MRMLLHSGGLDSHIIWLMDRTRIPVYIDHGQRNVGPEHRALAALAIYHKVTEGEQYPELRGMPWFTPVVLRMPSLAGLIEADAHIPHRNLAFLLFVCQSFAHNQDAVESIAYGALRGEASSDKSPAFIRAAAKALTESEGKRVLVEAPLLHTTKPAALRMVARLHPEWLPALALTRSCYGPTVVPCGVCQACFRRELAYWYAGLISLPPGLPTQTAGPMANLKRTPWQRWPALLHANLPALRALLHRMTPPPSGNS